MKLLFETPNHGWMTIWLNDHEMVVSDVPCDSLLLLTSALAGIMTGSSCEVVEWSLEPQYAEWIFHRSGDELSISFRERSDRKSIMIMQGDAGMIVDQIITALSDLGARDFWETDAEERLIWSWPFPSSELKLIITKRAEQVASCNPLPAAVLAESTVV